MDFKSIVITGASSGIGAALAQQLAAPGRYIGLLGRSLQRLESVASACRQKGADCSIGAFDVRNLDAVTSFLTSFDRDHPIDLLIANAGILGGRHADEEVENGDTARAVLEINLLAPVDAIHVILPAMRKRGSGDIVLVASLASLVPLPDAPAYSASKAGLLSYGIALRDALAPHGVRIVVACPGYVATPMATIHHGPRVGEISASDAAQRIIRGLRRDSGIIGFPFFAFWSSRLSLIVPEWVRRRGLRGARFYVSH